MAAKAGAAEIIPASAAGGANSNDVGMSTAAFVSSLNERIATISAARVTNIRPVHPDDSFFSKLDAALKKTSKFGQKLRQHLSDPSQRSNLEKEILSLNLSRYVPEVAAALVDQPKMRFSDVAPVLVLITHMHLRYSEFSQALLEEFKRFLQAESSTAKNAKVHIRLLSECILYGIFGDAAGGKAATAQYKQCLSLLLEYIKAVTPRLGGRDATDVATAVENIQLLNAYVLKYGPLLFGVYPKRMQNIPEGTMPNVVGLFLSADHQMKLRMPLNEVVTVTCVKMYADLSSELKEKQKEVLNNVKYRGEVTDDLKANYDELKNAAAKIREQAAGLADGLDLDLPATLTTDPAAVAGGADADTGNAGDAGPPNKAAEVEFYLSLDANLAAAAASADEIWTDMEEKTFYTSLPRLDEMLPEGCFRHTKNTASAIPAAAPTAVLVADTNSEFTGNKTSEQLSEEAVAGGEKELLEMLDEPTDLSKLDSADAVMTQNDAVVTDSVPASTTNNNVLPNSAAKSASSALPRQVSSTSSASRNAFSKLKSQGSKYSGFDDSYENENEFDFDDYEADEAENPNAADSQPPKTPFDEFLRRTLPNAQTAAQVDAACQQFCMQFNKRDNRIRLINELMGVSYRRFELFALYCRFAAVLHSVIPEIGNTFVTRVRSRFRAILHRNDPTMKLDYKIKIVRLLAELTKFRLLPKAQALLVVKVMLNHFSQPSVIEMLCSFLECCGRFLYQSPESRPRMTLLLDTLEKKKLAAQALSELHRSLLDAAQLVCTTTEEGFAAARRAAREKKRSPYQQYVRHLLYTQLSEETEDLVIDALRRMPWSNAEHAAHEKNFSIIQYITIHLSQPWRVKYGDIPSLASVVAGLAYYHPDIGVDVVDNIVEELRMLMELGTGAAPGGVGGSSTVAVHKQRAIASARYFGELYCFKLIEKNVLYAVLYSLVLYASSTGVDLNAVLDPPWNLTRLRQTMVILAACGEYFMRGSARKKLDMYLIYLRRYYWAKRGDSSWNEDYNPFPELVRDEFDRVVKKLRPDFELLTSWEASQKAVQDLETELLKEDLITKAMATSSSNGGGDAGLSSLYDDDDEDEDDDEDDQNPGDDDAANKHEKRRVGGNLTGFSAEAMPSAMLEDENAGYGGDPEQQAEDALAAEIDAMMAESFQQQLSLTSAVGGSATLAGAFPAAVQGGGGGKAATPMTIPLNVKSEFSVAQPAGKQSAKAKAIRQADAESTESGGGQFKFALMTRAKNNKQGFKPIAATHAEPFMQEWTSRAQENKKERVQMNRLTLGMNKRQELEEFYGGG